VTSASRKAARAVLTVLLWCLATYWAVFIGYTIKNLFVGGPRAALGWYMHISGPGLSVDPWSAKAFALRQAILFAATLALWFFRRRLIEPTGDRV
jgi:hypothetical protein